VNHLLKNFGDALPLSSSHMLPAPALIAECQDRTSTSQYGTSPFMSSKAL
jgi:hypothetical protein